MWSENKRKGTNPLTKTGYISLFLYKHFVDLKNKKSDWVEFKSAAKFVTRCLDKVERGDVFIEGNTSKTNFRLLGARPPKKEVKLWWLALFDYSIDVKTSFFIHWSIKHGNFIVIIVNWKRRLEWNPKC